MHELPRPSRALSGTCRGAWSAHLGLGLEIELEAPSRRCPMIKPRCSADVSTARGQQGPWIGRLPLLPGDFTSPRGHSSSRVPLVSYQAKDRNAWGRVSPVGCVQRAKAGLITCRSRWKDNYFQQEKDKRRLGTPAPHGYMPRPAGAGKQGEEPWDRGLPAGDPTPPTWARVLCAPRSFWKSVPAGTLSVSRSSLLPTGQFSARDTAAEGKRQLDRAVAGTEPRCHREHTQ